MRKSNNFVWGIILCSCFILLWFNQIYAQEKTDQEFSTIELITEPENAQVFINRENRGTTPVKIDSLEQGVYEIRLELSGYTNFNEKISVLPGDNKKLVIKLQNATGFLKILSWPENASVILNNDTIGYTPYTNPLNSGSYDVTLFKQKYYKYKQSITVTIGDTVKIDEKLTPKKKIQNIRRIVSGSLCVGFSVMGAYMHFIKLKAQDAQDDAWDDYMQPNLTKYEYDRRYQIYLDKVDETNSTIIRRNTYFSIAGLAGIGFFISIPF